MAIYYVANIKGTHPLTPEPKEPELARSILDSTLAGQTFSLPTLKQT